MLTEVMRHYSLAREPIDVGFFETEHHAQVLRDIRAAILSGRLIALTAVIGSGKTILWRRLRADLVQEGRGSCHVRCRSKNRRSPCRSWSQLCFTT